MKLCIIYNFAAHYRESVFVQIDQTFDCDWYFGKANADIKKMDYSLLRGRVTEIDSKHVLSGNWQKGVVKLLRDKKYQTYLVFAQTKDFSTWIFGLMARLFRPKKIVFFGSHGM